MAKISIIVPCYNEEDNISLFYKEIKKCFTKINEMLEIVFIDDGSNDETLCKIKSLTKDNCVKYISFSKNFGKESAMYAGLSFATGDYVVIMDVDMQDPPFVLLEMIEEIKKGDYDVVGSRRVNRKGEPIIRSFFARMFYKVINKMTKLNIVDGARDFRIMKRQVVDSILEMNEYNRFSKGIFSFVGYKVKWLEYENVERANGETKWSFYKLLLYAIEGIISFTVVPLMISFVIGIILVISSIVLCVIITLMQKELLCHFIWFIMLNTGIILIACGILGMYLSRIHLEVKKRPIYIIRETNYEI